MQLKANDFFTIPSSSTYALEKQTYEFNKADAVAAQYSFSNTDYVSIRHFGCLLRDKHDIVIDGHGASLTYRGHLTPFGFDGCENITLRNMTIDFDPPMVAEAIVTGRDEDYADVTIDPVLFPHICKDGTLFFDIGEKELCPLCRGSSIHFGADMRVNPCSGDDFVITSVEELGENAYRLHARRAPALKAPHVGDVIVLRHNARVHPGIFAENCKNITLENLTIHSCGGLGILTQFCENVTLRNVIFAPNTDKGRLIAGGRDDGLQAASCKGLVTVESCSFEGLMDDPINIHGCSMSIEKIEGNAIHARYMHPQAKNFVCYAKPGDKIALLDRGTMASFAQYEVEKCLRTSEETIMLIMTEPVQPAEGLLAIENITNTPDVLIKHTRFGSCRARGLLVTTMGHVVIEENLFESSGCGILLSGDANGWYESGACKDVIIRNNVFTDAAMSSRYQFTEGMISICPVIPQPDPAKPFHDRIVIEGNTFHSADTPVVYAFSVNDLTVANNRIFRSRAHAGCVDSNALIRLDSCCHAKIGDNAVVGGFRMDLIESKNCGSIE